MYGKLDLNGDTQMTFHVTHCYHNLDLGAAEPLFDPEELKKPFTGQVAQKQVKMIMNIDVPLRINQKFKCVMFQQNPLKAP
mmetsp:Transcript_36309/g.26934  ORF Transcript_36309/g.26934 Transcript_36309/m.26934 type:complete len:81 (+) Transcript_36309:324-566(+)